MLKGLLILIPVLLFLGGCVLSSKEGTHDSANLVAGGPIPWLSGGTGEGYQGGPPPCMMQFADGSTSDRLMYIPRSPSDGKILAVTVALPSPIPNTDLRYLTGPVMGYATLANNLITNPESPFMEWLPSGTTIPAFDPGIDSLYCGLFVDREKHIIYERADWLPSGELTGSMFPAGSEVVAGFRYGAEGLPNTIGILIYRLNNALHAMIHTRGFKGPAASLDTTDVVVTQEGYLIDSTARITVSSGGEAHLIGSAGDGTSIDIFMIQIF